ncbi:MAG: polynucleotide kinase-phosphatase, partial [Planctomycetota bacterium]
DEVDAVAVARGRLWTDRREERGPFDLIGDVHGCCDELELLLAELGYERKAHVPSNALEDESVFVHPDGRRAFFVGDLVDRGPRNLDALRLAATMVAAGSALWVPGNHDMKFLKKLEGRDVQITHGLAETLEELDRLDTEARAEFVEHARNFLRSAVSHFVVDDGKLVVAHAGMKERFQGRASGRVREFALYGETTGETDEFGLPVRHNWAAEYRGKAMVVYGHTPVPEAEWLNHTINLDTGCVFGGKLTALRYPEREAVSVPAAEMYAEPVRPFLGDGEGAPLSAQQEHDDVLDLADVCGKRFVNTGLRRSVTVREENAAAALEVMSRFAVDPKWLVYLPPTMSPSETTEEPGLLEHPTQAFSFFRSRSVPRVVCEEKHMGSRAVVVLCRNAETAQSRFGVSSGEIGKVYTRTGRRFFTDPALEVAFLDRLRAACESGGLWEELETSWVCLDCELMPWSEKARGLLRDQYASVGAAARVSLGRVVDTLSQAATRVDVSALQDRFVGQAQAADAFVDAYRRYCWEVNGLEDWRLAPFHVLASEGKVHQDRDHEWHMNIIHRLCAADPKLLLATQYRVVDLTDPESESDAVEWWTELTAAGGEGMVVKSHDFVAFGKKGAVQPALKCRGKEYLRIIYGMDYDRPEHLERLRRRGLGAKRSLAIREFALGLEGLQRFVRREPLRRVHECVFGVLALESEPVDPRL